MYYFALGELPRARELLVRALEQFRAIELPTAEVDTLLNLAGVSAQCGAPARETAPLIEQAVQLARTCSCDMNAAFLEHLALARRLCGDHTGAAAALQQATALYPARGDHHFKARALVHYAKALAASGDLTQAMDALREASDLAREANDPELEAFIHEETAELKLD